MGRGPSWALASRLTLAGCRPRGWGGVAGSFGRRGFKRRWAGVRNEGGRWSAGDTTPRTSVRDGGSLLGQVPAGRGACGRSRRPRPGMRCFRLPAHRGDAARGDWLSRQGAGCRRPAEALRVPARALPVCRRRAWRLGERLRRHASACQSTCPTGCSGTAGKARGREPPPGVEISFKGAVPVSEALLAATLGEQALTGKLAAQRAGNDYELVASRCIRRSCPALLTELPPQAPGATAASAALRAAPGGGGLVSRTVTVDGVSRIPAYQHFFLRGTGPSRRERAGAAARAPWREGREACITSRNGGARTVIP